MLEISQKKFLRLAEMEKLVYREIQQGAMETGL